MMIWVCDGGGGVVRHYHQMRRLHTMVHTWGSLLAGTTQSVPVDMPSSPSDNTTVRWAVRTNNASQGFLFVNNYQRLVTLPPKEDVRFRVSGPDGTVLFLPSEKSPAVTVESGESPRDLHQCVSDPP